MRLLSHSSRIVNFFLRNLVNMGTRAFWQKVRRVLEHRAACFHRLSEAEFQAHLGRLAERPHAVQIEPSNICNANCVFCAYQHQTRKKASIDKELFLKILNEFCALGGGYLALEVVVGEPTVNKHFLEFIQEAASRPEIRRIKTVTNAILLDSFGIPEIVESGITELYVSLAAFDAEIYRQVYRNPHYQRMRANVEALLRENHRRKGKVDITLGFRASLPINKLVSLPDYKPMRGYPHQVDFNVDYDTWTGKVTEADLLPGMRLRPRITIEREPCSMLYFGPVVYANGKVGLCGCRDFDAQSELIIGDVREESLLDLWRGDKVKALRARFYEGRFPDICSTCTMYTNLDNYRTRKSVEYLKFLES